MTSPDMEVIREIPGYKVILKAILKSQIQQLVEQLASHTDEESVILTASVSDGTLSHLGSDSGKGFLEEQEDVKSQFLGFCLKRHHKQKQLEKEQEKEKERLQALAAQSHLPAQIDMGPGPRRMRMPYHGGPRQPFSPQGYVVRSPGGAHRHEPYHIPRNIRKPPSSLDPSTSSLSQISQSPQGDSANITLVKSEPMEDSSGVGSDNVNRDDENTNSSNPPESAEDKSGDDADVDPAAVKVEAISETEFELEITGVEPGVPPSQSMPQDNWGQNVSTAMGFDSSMGAMGSAADMSSQQGYRFKGSRDIISIILLLGIVGLCEGSDLVQRLNYGIVFKQTDKLFLGTDVWYHTFEIDLPNEMGTPYIKPCTKNKSCSHIAHLISQLNSVRSEMSSRINATIQTIEELVPEAQPHKSRSKRALLPFIGTLSKGLFGTATVEDVEMLAKHMNKINKMTLGLSDALVQHEDHLSSYMNTANQRMDNLMSGIKGNMMTIKFIQNELYTNINKLESSFDHVLSILIQHIQTATIVNQELEELKLGITNLVNGVLSPLLISNNVMQSTLSDIQIMLQTKFTGFHLAVKNAKEVYSTCKFLYARNGTKLYVTIKFPISNLKKPIKLYQIVSVPVPINATSEHATQILPIPNYFLITSDHQYYATPSNLDLSKCTGTNVKYCSYNTALSPVTTQSCVLALYANDKEMVKSLCEFRYVQSVIKPSIMELTPNSLLLFRTPLLSMQCMLEHKMVQGCDFCIFKLPCKCSVSTNEFYFAPRLANCHKNSQNATIVHPVNLALLQHFFETEFVNKIFADTTFQTPLNVSIPRFQFYNHEMSNIIAADNKAHLNLSKMAEATKNDAKIFQSLAEPLIDNQIQLQNAWPDINTIIMFCSIGVTTILGFITLWTVYRLKKLSVALVILQKAQAAKAMATEFPAFIYKSKTTESDENDPNFQIDISWDQANFILLCIILLIAIIFIWKKIKNNRKHKLCLEVVAGKHCVLVDIHYLPMCLSNYHIQLPSSITELEVIDSCMFPKLHVSWPGLSIKNTLNDEAITIASEIDISFRTARKLKLILSKPFLAYLHTYHSGILSPI